MNNNRDAGFPGPIGAVTGAAGHTLPTVATLGRCGANDFTRAKRLRGRANPKRAPPERARYVALRHGIDAGHYQRPQGRRAAPLVRVSSVAGSKTNQRKPRARGDRGRVAI
jgi:hypothetical protein